MDFSTLQLKNLYDTSKDDLVVDFFEPILTRALKYDRGVGYFSSGWLKVNAKGMGAFAQNGGKARWITSPILSKVDWEQFQIGAEARQDEIIYDALAITVNNLKNSLETDTLNALAWLIADNIIDFKLAIPRHELSGEFHDKFGVFTDSQSDQVAFSGSYNDSIHGLTNYESIIVFHKSQYNFANIIEAQELRFQKLWSNLDDNVRVMDIPESILKDVVKLRTDSRPYKIPQSRKTILGNTENDSFKIKPYIPASLRIRDYQQQAYEAWLKNSCKGFFEMATGTGKTITALYCATKEFEKDGRIALIIAVPYIHLADQWAQEVKKFNYFPILALGSSSTWQNLLSNDINSFCNHDRDVLCVITTHATFSSSKFRRAISSLSENTIFVADEAHHLGTEVAKNAYPQRITKRLALSATPTRWFDEEGTNNLFEYFGKSVFSFPLDKAIEAGFLTEYYYFPVLVDLTKEEASEYYELTKKIAPLFFKKNKSEKEIRILDFLIRQRADIGKNAQNKIDSFKATIGGSFDLDHVICYSSPQQKDKILDLLGNQYGITTHQFTHEEDRELRQDLLVDFDKGKLKCLVAIKCLDEGVDVPSTQRAFFLANSTNPREFVQRRGRVLRKSPGKDYAYLYDFIVVPPEVIDPDLFEMNKSIIKKELSRFFLFSQNSLNRFRGQEKIWELAKKFNIFNFEE